MSNGYCNNPRKTRFGNRRITIDNNNQFCAGELGRGVLQDSCSGDSGGPLYCCESGNLVQVCRNISYTQDCYTFLCYGNNNNVSLKIAHRKYSISYCMRLYSSVIINQTSIGEPNVHQSDTPI